MRPNVSTITYENIDNNIVTNRLVTQIGNLYVAKGRNPYGTHNLILVTGIDGELRAIRHGNVATLAWVASEEATDRKRKKAIRRAIKAVGYNPLANKENRLEQLAKANYEHYLTRREAERKARVCLVHSCDGKAIADYSEEEY